MKTRQFMSAVAFGVGLAGWLVTTSVLFADGVPLDNPICQATIDEGSPWAYWLHLYRWLEYGCW